MKSTVDHKVKDYVYLQNLLIALMMDSKLIGSGVNFINVLQAAFTHIDPKSAKRQLV